MSDRPLLILASASSARADLLRRAGIDFEIVPSCIDEGAVRQACFPDRPPSGDDLAAILARAKAMAVSQASPGRLVLGADQVLCRGEDIFSKPTSLKDARDQLMRLRNRGHRLISAVAGAKDGEIVWDCQEQAQLTMRDFSNEFLGGYLAAEGDGVCESVGGYKIEGRGIQLFARIEGDATTIQGLPMLRVLEFLRNQGYART